VLQLSALYCRDTILAAWVRRTIKLSHPADARRLIIGNGAWFILRSGYNNSRGRAETAVTKGREMN